MKCFVCHKFTAYYQSGGNMVCSLHKNSSMNCKLCKKQLEPLEFTNKPTSLFQAASQHWHCEESTLSLCSHKFHYGCISKWITENGKDHCPMCSTDICTRDLKKFATFDADWSMDIFEKIIDDAIVDCVYNPITESLTHVLFGEKFEFTDFNDLKRQVAEYLETNLLLHKRRGNGEGKIDLGEFCCPRRFRVESYDQLKQQLRSYQMD